MENMKERKNILLILSAILVPEKMREQFGEIPSVLYPLGDGTIFDSIIHEFSGKVDECLVVAMEKYTLITNYISWKKIDANVVLLEKTNSIAESLYAGLLEILSKNSMPEVIVSFGDTFVVDANIQELSKGKDTIYYSRKPYSEDWTFIEFENGEITSIEDKIKASDEKHEEGNCFIGLFKITDPANFIKNLVDCIKKEKDTVLLPSAFYTALFEYSKNHKFTFIRSNEWIDTGHIGEYTSARAKVATRVFNSISIDRNRGLLRKTSRNIEKFVDEILWYKKLPDDIRYMAPNIYSYSTDFNSPYVEMEYYGYSTLHEKMVFGNLPLVKWQQIFDRLFFLMKDMQRYTVTDSEERKLHSLRNMYIEKTRNRLGELSNNELFKSAFKNGTIVNGEIFPAFDLYASDLERFIEDKLIKYSHENFCIIHGDLCFSNILCEDSLLYLRIIDPRGKFGSYDIYGDRRYEFAKVLHSVEGGYDFIIEDMFRLNYKIDKEGRLVINYRLPEKAENLIGLLFEKLEEYSINVCEIRLIEAVLFLSMIPLHSDYTDRQIVFWATGIRLLDKAGYKWKEIFVNDGRRKK